LKDHAGFTFGPFNYRRFYFFGFFVRGFFSFFGFDRGRFGSSFFRNFGPR
jgi:hypothetical protein